jgi:hypothetical protein
VRPGRLAQGGLLAAPEAVIELPMAELALLDELMLEVSEELVGGVVDGLVMLDDEVEGVVVLSEDGVLLQAAAANAVATSATARGQPISCSFMADSF